MTNTKTTNTKTTPCTTQSGIHMRRYRRMGNAYYKVVFPATACAGRAIQASCSAILTRRARVMGT